MPNDPITPLEERLLRELRPHWPEIEQAVRDGWLTAAISRELLLRLLEDAGADTLDRITELLRERAASPTSERAGEPQGWRPIESAPKNRDWLIVGNWMDGVLLWYVRARWKESKQAWVATGGPVGPTHYFDIEQLPAPPTGGSETSDRTEEGA